MYFSGGIKFSELSAEEGRPVFSSIKVVHEFHLFVSQACAKFTMFPIRVGIFSSVDLNKLSVITFFFSILVNDV